MSSLAHRSAVVASLFVVAACSDPIGSDPARTAALPPTALSATLAEIDGSYLVRFEDRAVPAGFHARVAALGGSVLFAHAGAGVGAVQGLTAKSAAQLAALVGVSDVVEDDATLLDDPTQMVTEEVALGAVESAAAPATAFFFPRQWHLRAIHADAAWLAGRLGSPSVRVAILDTGLDYTHPDLAGRIDLSKSVSFVPSEDARVQATWPGAHPIADLHYHGTHVGATVSSNALAAAGVTSGVTLVGVKVCHAGAAPAWTGSCPTSGVLAGVLYAADQGVHVANMSLGGSFVRRDASAKGGVGPSFLAIINQTFLYAQGKGVTLVVSAGNSNADMDHDGNGYKAYCTVPSVVCVSATGPTAAAGTNGPWTNVDARAPYSNYGRSAITVAAPGGAASPVYAACSRFTIVTPLLVCNTGTFVVGVSGTSMASPHAAGVAALISETLGRNPAAVRDWLQQTADDLGESGTDPIYGKGRINAARAVGVN